MKFRSRALVALLAAFLMLFSSACSPKVVDKYVDREVEVEVEVEVPDSINVENIAMKKGESREIAVSFVPAHAYAAYAFSVPVERQSEISIKNGVVTALKASDRPITVTAYALDDSLDMQTEFTVSIEGYYDPADGAIYAFNRAGSFDYPVPATSLDPAATGWTVQKNIEEEINVLSLSFYDLEEEERDPNSTRWAPRYSHEDVSGNNVKIFDPFEFDVTFSRTLVNVPAGTWHFSMYMEGNNVNVTWNITGTDEETFSIASTPTWYYKDLVLTEAKTIEFSIRLAGETTNPDDSTSSPWVFFDSVRAINELAVEKDDDTAPSVVESAWTNYVVDPGFGAADANTPLASQSPDYAWKVGNTLNALGGKYVDNVVNAPDIVTSDTNFQIDANGLSGKFKTTNSYNASRNQRFTVYQDITGIPHNFYTFSGYFMGGPDSIQSKPRTNAGLRLFVTYKDIMGNEVTKFQNITVQSYFEGYMYTGMEGIEIVDGNARIGFDFCRSAWGQDGTDCWFQFDDFSFAATNELNDEDIDIFNTGGLTQLLGMAADLADADALTDTGFTGSGSNATAEIDTTADNQAVGAAKTLAVTATAATTYTLTQEVSVTAGKPYVFSALIKSDGEYEAYVTAGSVKGTKVSNAATYMQTYAECTPTTSTLTISLTVTTLDAASVYFDWIIFADASIGIAVDDVVDMWVGATVSPYVQFTPSSKAEACKFEVVTQTPVAAFTVTEAGVVTADKAGTATIRVTHAASGATTTFAVSAIERPLMTGISLENKESLEGAIISTKLLLVTRTPAASIIGAITYTVADDSKDLVSISGTRMTMLKAGTATINVSALDANGDAVTTTFEILIRTEREYETLQKLAAFKATANSVTSFEDGGWTVTKNVAPIGEWAARAYLTANEMFGDGNGTIWRVGGAQEYHLELTMTYTNMQGGTYSFSSVSQIATKGMTITVKLNDEEAVMANTANSAAKKTTTVEATILDGGSLTVTFVLAGSADGPWANSPALALSLTKTA